MLLVVFGAGASYDSVEQYPVHPAESHHDIRPPLANQLFENRPMFVSGMERFPDCKALVPLLRGAVPVEQQLAKFEEQARTFPERHRQLTAIRFYLQFALWECQRHWSSLHKGITNYATFLDEIERWRYTTDQHVCFVTFNYDTMLEQAMEEVHHRRIEGLDGYISHEHYKIIKLHGSIDWAWKILSPQINSPAEIIEKATYLTLSKQISKSGNTPVRFDDGHYGFPTLAIPVQKKNEFTCPQDHLEKLAGIIPKVTKIITVGWRGTEENFLAMLKKPLTGLQGDVDLMVVSDTDKRALETAKNLGMDVPSPRKRAMIDTGFSGLIRTIGYLESFLT